MHRFYISPDNWNPAALTLSDAEAHHARDVLRLSRVRRFRRFTQIRKSELKERRFATAELINGAYKAPLLVFSGVTDAGYSNASLALRPGRAAD